MTSEYRIAKINQIKDEIPDADHEECITALHKSGWDVISAIRVIKIDKLVM